MEKEASQLERDHVHNVYEKIAPYFNDIRYKAWPKVRQFLLDQEPGSLIADIGCGNGKYLHINKKSFTIGSDCCLPLVDLARNHGHEVQICSTLKLPYRNGCFDAILSIAVIHHFSTKERRIRALKEMARTLRVGGRIMIYVWAMEQKRRKFEKQDIFVPWNPEPPSQKASQYKLRKRPQNTFAADCSSSSDISQAYRKTKSTSSVGNDEVHTLYSSFEKSLKIWLFSRSLDSILELGGSSSSATTKRLNPFKNAGHLLNDTSRFELFKSNKASQLMEQVSNLFVLRQDSDEDVFSIEEFQNHRPSESIRSHLPKNDLGTKEKNKLLCGETCAKIALPDLVPHPDPLIREANTWNNPDCNMSICPDSKTGLLRDFEKLLKMESPSHEERVQDKNTKETKSEASLFRYYHVFKEGELQDLIETYVDELHVIQTYFDHANWCVVAEKIQVWKI
ncbi:TRM9B methyltransferase, partial [Polypterus senegalus]